MPVGVALAVEKLQRGFLWGDGGSKRKIHAVKWEEVCKSKSVGGLGIGRILVKNNGLLTKWIWRFGRERDALWHRVLVAKYVRNMFKEGSLTAKIISEGFSMVVGKSDRVEFWSELKWDSKSLSEAFPRVFALASKKSGHVQDFGRWLPTSSFRRSLEGNLEVYSSIQMVICNGKGVGDSVSVLMLNLKDACVESRRVKNSVTKDLVPPLMNTFKFNVDRSVRGLSRQAGMGGILRDCNGRVVCLFYFFIGSMDSNVVEVMAIHKAIEICSSSSFLTGQMVSIVSDSKVAVSWIHNEDFGSLD
ncbi:hypothetical protein Ddye_027736 [Dipteronia dyeriana]|uniref:RNase H type-1 domain-containing protein n=1 Tax=Dipteronia dyeriana TaxID=168575 RepID=A0AAD9TPW9_9ROSI|nr:hypothetical protein Ddye_027736 [Dipteronia dyeriana]